MQLKSSYEFPPCLDLVLMPSGYIVWIVDQSKDLLWSVVLYSAVLFAAISAMKCFKIYTTRQVKIILPHGRMITMMQPSILLICFTLVACFAGQADAFFSQGPCLDLGTGDSDGCTAKEVTGMVTNYTGPSSCLDGTTIVGNITTTLMVNSANRYDIGVYVGLNGSDAKIALYDDCLLQQLGTEFIDSDQCIDARQGVYAGFQIDNFEILCEAAESGVNISVCFVWDNNASPGPNPNCPRNCTSDNSLSCIYPGAGGSVSSVTCSTIQIQ
jgi:hypothetical protein